MIRRRMDEVGSLKVRGLDPETGHVEHFDLINARIVREIEIRRIAERNRRADPDSAFEEIAVAVRTARDDLANGAVGG